MSKRFFRNSALLAAALFLVAAAPGPEVREKENREPVVITSDRMEADELGKTVTFTGDVTLKKETMTLTADHLVVYYDAVDKTVREMRPGTMWWCTRKAGWRWRTRPSITARTRRSS